MGEVTGVSWADHSWGAWRGCAKVSAGCVNCYGERDMLRYGHDPHAVVRAATATFNAPLKWERKAAADGVRRRVFVCPWSDFWIGDTNTDEWRSDALEIMRRCEHLDFLIPTKRPALMVDWFNDVGALWTDVISRLWLGVTVENQEAADLRIPLLLQVPAAVRWVSCEPLLGPVELGLLGTIPRDIAPSYTMVHERLSWCVVGGESGPSARPMSPEWARSLRDQCAAARMPFYLKQWGEWCPPDQLPDHIYRDVDAHDIDMAEGRQPLRVGVQRAGHLLDGVSYQAFPAVSR
jgi:protein gp37